MILFTLKYQSWLALGYKNSSAHDNEKKKKKGLDVKQKT